VEAGTSVGDGVVAVHPTSEMIATAARAAARADRITL
jgi:hypothetical protein